ncbi:MAG: zinc-binding dehydrogenase [Anaerolineae bacterium]
MRAAVITGHGGLEVVQCVDDLPIPEPAAGEVRLKMHSAALNRLDLFVRVGWPGLNLPFPHVIGSDGAGYVDALGAGVQGLSVGDAVAVDPSVFPAVRATHTDYENQDRIAIMGEHHSGFAAEYVCVPAANCVKVPDGFDLQQAAAAGLVYVTAWHSLITRGGLQAGDRVLIVGAGGGVNTASIQIARLAGATVYVIGSSEEKCARALEMGAHYAINRQEHPQWSKEVYRLTDKLGVDYVVDNVGKDTLGQSMRALRIGGSILVVGGTSGYNAELPLNQLFARQIAIIGSTMGTHKDYVTVMNLIFAGKLKAVVGKVFPLEQAREAQATLEAFDVFGKVVLSIEA